VADGEEIREGQDDDLPVAAGLEVGGVGMAVAPRGVEAQLVAFAVALEAEMDGAVGGDVELGVVALDGGEAAVVLEGDGAGEDGVAGFVEGQAGLRAPAHDVVVFDLPAGEAFGAAELDEGAVGGGGHGRRRTGGGAAK